MFKVQIFLTLVAGVQKGTVINDLLCAVEHMNIKQEMFVTTQFYEFLRRIFDMIPGR